MLRPARLLRRGNLRDLADEELMTLVGEGDVCAFELVFARHGGPAFSLAYRMCGRRAMAEDIVQESFLSLWRSGARYDPARGSVRSWVLRVVHNRAVDALRRHSARASRDVADEVTLQQMPAPEHTESEVARREQANLVHVALAVLPAEQRQVIELAYFGGFTHTEIAHSLELPIGTVKGRMRLGLAKMKSSIGTAAEVPA